MRLRGSLIFLELNLRLKNMRTKKKSKTSKIDSKVKFKSLCLKIKLSSRKPTTAGTEISSNSSEGSLMRPREELKTTFRMLTI